MGGLEAWKPPPAHVDASRMSKLAADTAALWHEVDCPVPDCAVVWLHGLGETEVYWQELFEECGVFELREAGECRWIMPRAEMAPCTARFGALSFQWFDTPDYPVCLIVPGVPDYGRQDEDPDQIRAAVQRVHEAILALEVEGVPAERIVIAGFGQGAALAVHSATSYPKTLAGCAMLSGYVPCRAELKKAARKGLSLDLLWLHGINDAVVHTDAATAQAKELSELGVCLDFRLSFDFGHETTGEELEAFRLWLISKMKKPPELEEEEGVAEDGTEAGGVPVKGVDETNVLRQDPWGAPQRVA